MAIANAFLQRYHVLGETEFSAYLPLALLWILISSLRKDYKIGRTDEYDKTLSSFSVTLLWFLGATAILWTPLQEGNYRWIQIGALGLTLGLLMGIFRVAVQMVLR
jgi:putative colanic acid biosynthesis UDP-glucose lipid carrier transferase